MTTMEELRKQLATLDSDQVKRLLSESGHDALLPVADLPVDVAQRKAEGNALFKQGRFEEAAAAYTQCIEASSRPGDQVDATLFSNRAMAFLKLRRFDRVVDDCTSALGIAPSIKPYLRRATAHVGLGDAASAVQDLGAALEFEPGNREALRLLEQLATDPKHTRNTRLRAALLVAFRDGWKAMPVKGNPVPPGLNGHVLFTVPCDEQQRVYLFGGRAVRDQRASVYVMDERDYSWDLVCTDGVTPTPRAWHSMNAIGDDTVAAYGGVSASAEDPHVHMLKADPSSDGKCNLIWEADSSKKAPSSSPFMLARSGHAAITVEGENGDMRVVIFGGRTKHGVSDELWSLSLNASEVHVEQIVRSPEPLESAWPAPRDGHSMLIWDDQRGNQYAVVFGGNGQQTEEKMNDVWLLDVVSQRWTQVACAGDVPEPRSYHSAHIVDGFMITIGGRTQAKEDGDAFLLDLASKEWFRVPIPKDKSLTPRAWHASILRSLHDEIYLLGGGTHHGPSREAAVLNLRQLRAFLQQIGR